MSKNGPATLEQFVKQISTTLSRIEDTASVLRDVGSVDDLAGIEYTLVTGLSHVHEKLFNILSQLEKHVGLDENDMLLANQLAAGTDSPAAVSPMPKKEEDAFANESDLDESCFDDDLVDDVLLASETSNCADDSITDEVTVVEDVDKKYLDVLKNYFGFKNFKPMQWKIIENLMNGKKDQLVVMATGYGKSLCYQYTSVYTGRVTIVISPLLSLMEDQVLSLLTAGVSACQLSSTQVDNYSKKDAITAGQYRIVYMTPERVDLDVDFLIALNRKVGIDLIAIDEAHCVSQWGHDFRPSYRTLDKLKTTLPQVPLLALTATATPPVRKDICKSLKLCKPVVTCTGFDRPNLYLSVTMKTPSMANDLRSIMKAESLNTYSFEGSTVIYCPTRKQVENCQDVMEKMGVECRLYHAGIPYTKRRQAHKDFVNDKVKVIIATVAFGMGIDKPDVRRVIHYGAPRDIESYYQEIGRAGRDGNKSECITFYSHSDFNTSRYFMKDISNKVFLDHKRDMLRKMEAYLATTSCRRKEIIAHFEDTDVSNNVGGTEWCCDNCRRQLARGGEANGINTAKVDIGADTLTFLQATEGCGERFGMTTVCGFIIGSKNKTFTSKFPFLTQRKGYGEGSGKSEVYWKAIGRQLLIVKFLDENQVRGGFGATISISAKGRTWLGANQHSPMFEVNPTADLTPFLKYTKTVSKSKDSYTHIVTVVSNPQSYSTILPKIKQKQFVSVARSVNAAGADNPEDEAIVSKLFEKLLQYRTKVGEESDVDLSSYMIATNKNLLDIARLRPTNMENLLKVESLPKKRAENLGEGVFTLIKNFAAENKLDTDVFDKQLTEADFLETLTGEQNTALWSLKDNSRHTYLLFQGESKSLEEVAGARGIKPSTVISHLCDAIVGGLPVDVRRLGFPNTTQQLITQAIRSAPVNSDISRVAPIKENLPDYVTYDQIRITLSILKYEYCVDVKTPSETDPHISMLKTQVEKQEVKPLQQVTTSTSNKRSLPIWLSASAAPKHKQPNVKKKKSVF